MDTLPDLLPTDNLSEGKRLRDVALAHLEASRPVITRRLQRAAVRIALDNGTVTADDVRAVVPIPNSVNPKVNGSALKALARLGILRAGGYAPSTRPIAHARPVRVWHLGDRDAALLWLVANPELDMTTD